MTYYKVKSQFDQFHISRTAYTLVRGALLTEKEMRKERIPAHMVTAVEVSAKDIKLACGLRFEANEYNPWLA